jgi:putative tricarboxylic transport membrane protein
MREGSSAAALKNVELWAALLWLGLAVFVTFAGWDLGVGTRGAPGSGFLVFWGGLLMSGLALAIVVSAIRHGGPTPRSLWAGTRWPKVMVVLASLAAYAGLLDLLGFLLATVPLLLVLLRAVDPVPWRAAAPIALGATVGIWWVLKRALLIQLPSGALGIG